MGSSLLSTNSLLCSLGQPTPPFWASVSSLVKGYCDNESLQSDQLEYKIARMLSNLGTQLAGREMGTVSRPTMLEGFREVI